MKLYKVIILTTYSTLANTMRNFEVFHRTWWKRNPDWPNGLEPSPGRRFHIGYAETEEDAVAMCKAWAKYHPPGDLSDKAEYEQV